MSKPVAWLIGLLSALMLGVLVAAMVVAFQPDPYASMTCDQLTAQMLKMTGAGATEPYDLEKVRAINQARTEGGCW